MSRIKLPDHRMIGDDDVLLEFSEEQVGKLRIKYGFEASYPLEEKLDRIATRFDKPRYFRNPPPKSEREKLLKAIQKSASNLEKSLRRLGESEFKLIGKIDTDWNNEKKLKEVSSIKNVVDIVLIYFEVATEKGSRPSTVKKKELIARLSGIYEKGTGKIDKYTQPPGTNNYYGNRVKFIEEIVGILNAPVNNRFIGETLKEFFA